MNVSNQLNLDNTSSAFSLSTNKKNRVMSCYKPLIRCIFVLVSIISWDYSVAENTIWKGRATPNDNWLETSKNWSLGDPETFTERVGVFDIRKVVCCTFEELVPAKVNIIGGSASGGQQLYISGGNTTTNLSTVTLGDLNNPLDNSSLTSVNENVGLNSTEQIDSVENDFRRDANISGGFGKFNQYGNTTHTISNTLNIGRLGGSYNLFGGNLNAANITNNGTFNQSGGTISGIGSSGTIFNNNANALFTYAAGSFNGELINNGTANFNPSVLSTFSANISGTGSLNKLGDETLILTGDNSYSGGTTVSGGVLQGNTRSLQGNIVNNATVVFDQADKGIYVDNMSGEGRLIKQNNGTLVINGTNTYKGGTTVDGGNLQIGDDQHTNASIDGAVTINPGSILSGHGRVNGNVFNNGTLSPGGSIGYLTVNGNVTFTPSSVFHVEISPSRASALNVEGMASLNNAHVTVLAGRGAYSPRTYTMPTNQGAYSRTYTILNSHNTNSGRFEDVTITNQAANPSLALLTPSLQFYRNRVDLTLSKTIDPTGVLPNIDIKLSKHRDRIVSGRLNAPLGINCPENRYGFWARGLGMLSSADASGSTPGYEGGTGGAIMGFDHQFSQHLSLGIAGFTSHTDVTTFQGASNNNSSDNVGVSLYGMLTSGPWQFKSVLSYDNSTYKAQHAIPQSVALRTGQSRTHANHISNYDELSYTFKSHDFSLQPLIGLNLGWLRQNGFSERGGSVSQNLSVNGRTLYTLDTLAGVRVRHELDLTPKLKAQFEVRAIYDHDFGTLEGTTTGRFGNGPVGTILTADRPGQRDAGILGASINLLSTDSLNFYLDYNAEIRGGQNTHFFNAGIRYVW